MRAIENSIGGIEMFDFQDRVVYPAAAPYEEQLAALREKLAQAPAVLVWAGAGLSTAAGLTYAGARFQKYFFDFAEKYGIHDMYAGGFYPFPSQEVYWAWWSRHIYFNRYVDAPRAVYPNLRQLIEKKEYFVLTTNVDHQFQRAGFDPQRLFYTQGDYGLLQSVQPEVAKTYENREMVEAMLEAQGVVRGADGIFEVPPSGRLRMTVPRELVPVCPDDGRAMMVSVRCDDRFVEEEGWHAARARYHAFLAAHQDAPILYLELGVGCNTPVIIKYPFWYYTRENPNAFYISINLSGAACAASIRARSLCMEADIGRVLSDLIRTDAPLAKGSVSA